MAKNKKENYTPQFDFNNIEETVLETKTCKGCGKTGKHLGLNKDGLCFECLRKTMPQSIKLNSDEMQNLNLPNEKLFLEYSKKISLFSINGGGCLPTLIISLIMNINFKKRMLRKFHKYNSETVVIQNNEWCCPYCRTHNYYKNIHCKTCGVLPDLKEYN